MHLILRRDFLFLHTSTENSSLPEYAPEAPHPKKKRRYNKKNEI